MWLTTIKRSFEIKWPCESVDLSDPQRWQYHRLKAYQEALNGVLVDWVSILNIEYATKG